MPDQIGFENAMDKQNLHFGDNEKYKSIQIIPTEKQSCLRHLNNDKCQLFIIRLYDFYFQQQPISHLDVQAVSQL